MRENSLIERHQSVFIALGVADVFEDEHVLLQLRTLQVVDLGALQVSVLFFTSPFVGIRFYTREHNFVQLLLRNACTAIAELITFLLHNLIIFVRNFRNAVKTDLL
jgi:hypothetical protein